MIFFAGNLNGLFNDSTVSFVESVKIADGDNGILISLRYLLPGMKKSHFNVCSEIIYLAVLYYII